MPRKKKDMTIEGMEQTRAALEADIDKLELKRAVLEGTARFWEKAKAPTRGCSPTGRRRSWWRA